MKKLSIQKTPQKRTGSRTRRYIFISILLLALGLGATQVFLHQTSVGSPRFIPMTFLLHTGTAIVVLALLILATLLGRNLVKLYFERKSGQVGSGFKSKLVRIFIVLSLLPAVLLFFLAYGLFSSQMEQWFKAPREEMMENSRLLAERYYEEAKQRGEYFAANIAGYIQASEKLDRNQESALKTKLTELCHQFNIDNIRVFNRQFELVVDTGNTVSEKVHQDSLNRLIQQAMNGQAGFHVARLDPEEPEPEISWATAFIRGSQGDIVGAVLTETVNPGSAVYRAGEVKRAYDQYQQLQQKKDTLLYNTFLILGLSTLLIVFAFSWFALYLAKRITVPIQALAQGAAAVAAGSLNYRVHCPAFDELDSLITSFNRMTGDLQENQKRIALTQQSLRSTNVELDDRRRYIETILQTIATGVISLDSEHRIRTMNRAAIDMLQLENFSGEAKLEEVIQSPASDILRGILTKSAVLGRVVKNIRLEFPGKSLQVASIVTPLTDSEGQPAGWVVVLDDMTELLRMEKLSAWQEVARRLAHEIKNPLTPIQLSAERVLRRYKQIGAPPQNLSGSWQDEFRKFDKILEECIQTIIQEAGSLKGLVDEFSRFSRLPEVRLEESDLHAILDATLGLYNGRIRDVSVEKDYDPEIPKLQLDTEQMKRVFINLFDNALEAMAGNTDGKVLRLHTRLDSKWNSVSIEISDSGRGFPEEYQDSLFLPYFSARKGGTGLGLAIVRQIVSDHNGKVRAEPSKPVGTKIIIDLPLASV